MKKNQKERFESLLRSLPNRSGVYRMIDKHGVVLYVGKSRNLKARVTSYFRASGLATKTMRLISRTDDIQFTVTSSETEALLLEQTLIKKEQPSFNVLLRDDKSYPYIHFTNHEYPRIKLHRGSKKEGGMFFGPYPSAAAVRKSISILQRLFLLRPCKDSYFKNRSRACLQHQIHRCSAPCVGFVSTEEYAEDIQFAQLFLRGKSQSILDDLKSRMERASHDLEFEAAGRIRDQIQNLRKVQEEQHVHTSSGDVDAFAIAISSGCVCVQGMFIRDGQLLGHRTWFPTNELDQNESALLSAFVAQYYLGGFERELPRTILTLAPLDDEDVLADALARQAGRVVEITSNVRASRARWLAMVQENAEIALATHLEQLRSDLDRFLDLQNVLKLEEVPKRLECLDISHTGGEETIASCVVFDPNGPLKSDYRRYRIQDVAAGDDYGAMAQAIERRYRRIQSGDGVLPDVLIVDGGRGQINRAKTILSDLMVEDLVILGISKGPGRKTALDTIWHADKGIVDIDRSSAAFHLLQFIRDEAHRFAITGHRARRQKSRRRSELDGIAGIGPKRKRDLLTHFGSTTSIRSASTEEIAKVPGISRKLADEIYGKLHSV